MIDRRTRTFAIGSVVLLETVLGLALLTIGPPTAAPAAATTSIASFDALPHAPPSVAPRREAIPTPVMPPEPIVVPAPVLPPPSSEMVTSLLAELDKASLSGGACDLSGPVQLALQTSPAVQAALARIPMAQRSVANAVMLWDGSWSAASERLAPEAWQVIRDVVAATAAAAGDACRLQSQSGPRLLYLPGEGATTVLAMGSGQWRWQDVVDTAAAPDVIRGPAQQIAAARNSQETKSN